MASGAFSKAIKEANFSVNVSADGGRSFRNNAHMDQNNFRGRENRGNNGYQNRGDRGGRWQRGGFNRGGTSFRGRGRGNRGQPRGRGRGHGGYHPTSRLEEDDDGDSMMDNDRRGGNSRYNPYGGSYGQNRRRDRSPENRMDRDDNDSGWWKIVIPDAKKHSREWLLTRLKSSSTEPFSEVDFHVYQDNVVFFVNDKSAADALRKVSNKITTKDGSRLFLSVRSSRPPKNPGVTGSSQGSNVQISSNTDVETSPEKLEIYKNCLGNRFDPENVKLDLSNIYVDKVLRAGNVETRIWKPILINTILDIIHQLCPNLKTLDLSNNRMQRLDILSNLSAKCPELEEINLSNNSIRFTGELAKIKSHKKIEKLWFHDNPAYEQFHNDNGAYIDDIRNHLPNLKEIDGKVLPPSIKLTFDLDETGTSLPKSLGNYVANEEASKLVVNFLKNFFQAYDAADVNDRQQLLPAYHSDAVFSLCCNTGVHCSDNHANSFNKYFKYSRNLEKLSDRSAREQLIKHKKLTVVALLTELPQTKHNFDSFTLDIPVVTAVCIVFVVKGTFHEGPGMILRGFSRTFIAVPEKDSQLLLINDQLHIRAPTEKQVQAPHTSGTTQIQPGSTMQNTSYTAEQEELVKRFSVESKMNLKWSLDALVSNSWNFELAAIKFGELKKEGKIPDVAFQH